MDNLDDFYDPQLKLSNLEEMKLSGKYEPFFADIQDRRGLQEVFEEFQPQAVVHLAARAGVRPSLLHPKLGCDHKFEVFNLGNSRPVCVSYVVEAFEEALGKKARIKYLPLQPGDVLVTDSNLEKWRKLLSYGPRVTFEEGIRLFAEWFGK